MLEAAYLKCLVLPVCLACFALIVCPATPAQEEQEENTVAATEKPAVNPAAQEAAPDAEGKRDVPKGMVRPPKSSKQDVRTNLWGASFYGPRKVEDVYKFLKDGTLTKGGEKIGEWNQKGARIVFYANELAKRVAVQYNPLSGSTHHVKADKWTGTVDALGERLDWDDGGVWGVASPSLREMLMKSAEQAESGKNK